jgi:hypothetical protein
LPDKEETETANQSHYHVSTPEFVVLPVTRFRQNAAGAAFII